MPFGWFHAREASRLGAALADRLLTETATAGVSSRRRDRTGAAVKHLLQRADREVRALQVGFYKRARLANAFKWRLLEQGAVPQFADEATAVLVLNLTPGQSAGPGGTAPAGATGIGEPDDGERARVKPRHAKRLQEQGAAHFGRGELDDALACYESLIELKPKDAEAHNNLGAVLHRLQRHPEADAHFRRALHLRRKYPEALVNLGAVLQSQECFVESESVLRQAERLRPGYGEARILLAKALALQNKSLEARALFELTLRSSPGDVEAMLGMARVATIEGRFEEAEDWLSRVLRMEGSPGEVSALSAQVVLRRMTASDASWLERAQRAAAGGLAPGEEITLRFAMGKYHDDVGDYARAFQCYRRANALARAQAPKYSQDARESLVEDLIRAYGSESIAAIGSGASESEQPVFVVGMPRSGTTLVTQIIASHPAAKGAGEIDFWLRVGYEHEADIRRGLLAESARRLLARRYLAVLARFSAGASRVVDKAPVNADFLGVIHSVFPRARFICLQRDPIDTCLSCYFQPFYRTLKFTTDLADLAHYYRQHRRLVSHWRAVLPPGVFLEVPYEELVSDQVGWTRRILDFIGLDWNDRCLAFHRTVRTVSSSSTWQVRQPLYSHAVGRWRHYDKYLGPLQGLRRLDG